MIQTIYNMHRAMELEPDPMRRLSMMAVLRDTLKRMEQFEGERRR